LTLDEADAWSALGVNNSRTYQEYRSFLASGAFIERVDGGIEGLPALSDLWTSLRTVNLPGLLGCLERVPSFVAFLEFVRTNGNRPDWSQVLPMRDGTASGYKGLAEISGAALATPGRGICLTPWNGATAEFAEMALEAYSGLAATTPWVLSGQWLEECAWTRGVHPILARTRLEEALQQGLISRSFEGSTPETRFDSHTLDVLENKEGMPNIRRVHLYRGDFLMTSRASVRIRLERRGG
jgi:hypothetical protein